MNIKYSEYPILYVNNCTCTSYCNTPYIDLTFVQLFFTHIKINLYHSIFIKVN